MPSDPFAEAQAAHRAGNVATAESLYRAILAERPEHAGAKAFLGILLAQTGRVGEGAEQLAAAARLAPDDTGIRKNLAVVLHAAGKAAEAEREFLHLSGIEPGQADHHLGLGLALTAQGRFADAIGHFQRGIALAPGNAEALCNLGLACRAAGRLEQAIDAFRRASQAAPAMAKAHGNLGGALFEANRWEEAVRSWRRALELDPNHPDVQADLGIALAFLGRNEDAIGAFQAAVALDPSRAGFHYNLGRALQDIGRLDEALAAYSRVQVLDPSHVASFMNSGAIFKKQRLFDQALSAYDHAIALDPASANAHLNRGKALSELGRLPDALASCRRAVALAPDNAEARCELANLRRHLCDWDGIADDEEACRALVRRGAGGVDPFVLLSLSSSPSEQLDCARRWAADLTAKGGAVATMPAAPAAGRIRLGYFSADFRRHPVAYLVADLFERHDRDRFEVFAYSYGPDDHSPMRRRLEQGADHFVELRHMEDAEAAARIRADGIELLVDLTGYTMHTRTELLARRPAPVQVNYLGYAGTTGAGFMDYILADQTILPMAEQPFFDEKIVHLPDCYLPFDPGREMATRLLTRPQCGLPDDAFVFCAFHNAYKITPPVFDVWMRLLSKIPDGVLWLLAPSEAARANLRGAAAARGIEPERLIFASRVDVAEYLARHRLADLFLDVLPYNAHGSAADALWMGLPLVTCKGETFPGRVAASVLKAVGIPELITTDLKGYEELILALAQDRPRLAALRRQLEEGRSSAPLFDAPRFTRDIEAAYGEMAWRWRRGEAPAPFAVSGLRP